MSVTAVLLCLVAVSKEIVWWTRRGGIRADTFYFGRALWKKLRVERDVLPSNEFIERWVKAANMARVDGPHSKYSPVN